MDFINIIRHSISDIHLIKKILKWFLKVDSTKTFLNRVSILKKQFLSMQKFVKIN